MWNAINLNTCHHGIVSDAFDSFSLKTSQPPRHDERCVRKLDALQDKQVFESDDARHGVESFFEHGPGKATFTGT